MAGHLPQDCKLWLLGSSTNAKSMAESTSDSEVASQKLRRTHSMLNLRWQRSHAAPTCLPQTAMGLSMSCMLAVAMVYHLCQAT